MCHKYRIVAVDAKNDGLDYTDEADEQKALAIAEEYARNTGKPYAVYERISVCTPEQTVNWEGKRPNPPPASVSVRAGLDERPQTE